MGNYTDTGQIQSNVCLKMKKKKIVMALSLHLEGTVISRALAKKENGTEMEEKYLGYGGIGMIKCWS